MNHATEVPAHQPPRAPGSPSGPETVPGLSQRKARNGHDGQHHSSRTDHPPGQNSVQGALQSDKKPTPLAQSTLYLTISLTHPRTAERDGRHAARSTSTRHTEWSLSHAVTDRLCKTGGQPHVDFFATARNAKPPTYVSPLPDELAWKQDALSF